MERLETCIRDAAPDLLIILGDLKHSVPFTSRQEYREIPEIIDRLRSLLPVQIVPGNHDTGIEKFFEPEEILPKEGALVDGTGYVHGHMYPGPSLAGHLIIAGHHHPLASLRDDVGCSMRSPVYLFSPVDEQCLGFTPADREPTRVLFMPAFNELSGYDLLRTVRDPFSPLSRCVRWDRAEVFLPDGTFIGLVSSLEEHGADQEP
jgi:metallophosphoesterase superfamily enzyme